MAKLTWLGEEELHDGAADPSFTMAFEMKFKKGEPVEVSDKDIIRRARGNRFFEVSGVPGRPRKEEEAA